MKSALPQAPALQLPTDSDLELLFPDHSSSVSVASGAPPSPAEIDEFFKHLGHGGSYKAPNNVRLYIAGMPKAEYSRLSGQPMKEAYLGEVVSESRFDLQRPQRQAVIEREMSYELLHATPDPKAQALLDLYQWQDMGKMMYRMAHGPSDADRKAQEKLIKEYLAQKK